jgi:hypothetical protein
MALTYEPIYQGVVSSLAAYFEFTSIPNTYTDLVLVADCKYNSGGGDLNWRFNGDNSSNYSWTRFEQVASNRVNNSTYINTTDASQQGLFIAHFMQYKNTGVNKVVITQGGNVQQNVGLSVGTWRSNNAITSIQIYAETSGAQWAVGSRFSLYGIKAA